MGIKGKFMKPQLKKVSKVGSLHQNGGQEGRAGFLRHRSQGHGEERVQARRGEGKSGLPQRAEAWRRRVKKTNQQQQQQQHQQQQSNNTCSPSLSLSRQLSYVFPDFSVVQICFSLSLYPMNPLLILPLLSLFHFSDPICVLR